MPRPQETLVWERGSGPRMDISLKSCFKEPRLYQCSFNLCQTVLTSHCIFSLVPSLSRRLDDANDLLNRFFIKFWAPDTKKSYQSSSGVTNLPHCQKPDFPPRPPQLCSPALNCSSRCTEMETSYSIQLPAHRSIVLLASNVTCFGSECEASHCACETCPQLSAQRTHNWTLTVAIISTEFRK